MPVSDETSSVMTVVSDAATPWYFSSLTMSMATDLMMRLPPMSVPNEMASEHKIMSHSGKSVSPLVSMPNESAMPSRAMDMNFWPSCEPCRNDSMAAQMSWTTTKSWLALRRGTARKTNSMSLTMSQPMMKPATRLKTMP